jgi:hypothetical protein
MINIQAVLTGFYPKNGSGTLDDGTPWSTDRVDLYVQTPLDESKGARGTATTTYKIPGCEKHKTLADSLVGSKIVISCEMTSNGRNQEQKITPVSFSAAK